jgi:glutamate formiminotransferase/glutamate formiminotransferase/formiminotetrahydrofolate cyclodeaminase
LLAVPNVSEGRDFDRLERLQDSLGTEVVLLDRHTDIDHNRAVFTVAGEPAQLEDALTGLAAAAREIEMPEWVGLHPAIGALDVCPIVFIDPATHDAAVALALEVGQRIGGLGIPVFLYGELASSPERAERAWYRCGGIDALWQRMSSGELEPDFGPDRPHAKAGACLVTARAPIAAFNLELETDDVQLARRVAASIRQGGGGLDGVRAIGLALSTGRAQVSMNVHDPVAVPLAEVVTEASRLAEAVGTRVVEAELIGLIPEAAMAGYPEEVPIRGFDPAFHIIERRLG